MIKDSKSKARWKLFLIAVNAIFGLALIGLIAFWFLSVRPAQIKRAIELGQYRAYSMDNLPDGFDEIIPDYIGEGARIAAQIEEIDLDSSDFEGIYDAVPDVKFDQREDLLERTNQLLKKTQGKLDSAKIEPIAKQREKGKYAGKAKISIIVTNLGLNRRSTELALTLPKQCALGFLPYTKTLKPLLHRAQGKGHEIYLYLPMQTSKIVDNPGRYSLIDNLAPEENAARLNVVLNSHSRYDGIYSSYKEIFTDNSSASEMVFDHLHDRNLIFILGKAAKAGAGASKSPAGRRNYRKSYDNIMPTNIVIDEDPDRESIAAKLEELVEIAEDEGIALGYAQGFTLTIEMARSWMQTLKRRGVKLVPVSELLREYNL